VKTRLALLGLVLVPQLTGCIAVHTVTLLPRAELRPQDLLDARGVTTTSGPGARFDRNAPVWIARDTLFATVGGAPFRVALADVRQAWVPRPNIAASVAVTSVVVVPIVLVSLLVSVYRYPYL